MDDRCCLEYGAIRLTGRGGIIRAANRDCANLLFTKSLLLYKMSRCLNLLRLLFCCFLRF